MKAAGLIAVTLLLFAVTVGISNRFLLHVEVDSPIARIDKINQSSEEQHFAHLKSDIFRWNHLNSAVALLPINENLTIAADSRCLLVIENENGRQRLHVDLKNFSYYGHSEALIFLRSQKSFVAIEIASGSVVWEKRPKSFFAFFPSVNWH